MTMPATPKDGGRHPLRDIYDRVAPALALLILVIALAAGVGTYFNDRAITNSNAKRLSDNEHNAVVNCQNANESREASRNLWNYILDISAARQPAASPDEAAYLDQFRAYVNDVYAPHDCDHLDKKYELPSPPPLPDLTPTS
jgi:uncharacterized protein HemX